MLEHRIIVVEEPAYEVNAKAKFKGKYGSEQHKRYIFERCWINQPFNLGDWVVYRKRRGFQIIDIYTHMSMPIEWKQLKPCFIEIYNVDTNELILVHPSDIRKAKQ